MTRIEELRSRLEPLGNFVELGQQTDKRFDPETVNAYLEDPENFEAEHGHPAHHYSQTKGDWGDSNTVSTLLHRLDIDADETTTTIFGGFTGELAEALRETGCEVIFTDPIPEWVERAEERGFEAQTYPAENLPGELIANSDAFATFECYYPFSDPGSSAYTTLRFLTAPDGLLFAESESTRESLKEDGAERTFLTTLGPFCDTYDTERRYRETDGLRIYQFAQADAKRELVTVDAAVMASLYDKGSNEAPVEINSDLTVSIADELGIEPVRVEGGVGRLLELHRDLYPDQLAKMLPPNQFTSSGYTFNYEI